MTIDEKLAILRDAVGELTPEEETVSREMLEQPYRTHAGSHAPMFLARWIQMHRAARRPAA